jgi:aminopeptidase
MTDPRQEKLARVLVDYSLEIGPKSRLLISVNGPAEGLARAVYRLALRRGALVNVVAGVPGLAEVLLKEGSDRQIGFLPPEALCQAREYNAHLMLRAPENTRELSSCDPQKQKLQGLSRKPWVRLFYGREKAGQLAWCLTYPPTQALAMEADLSLTEFEDFYYRACLCEARDPVAAWRAVARRQEKLARFLSKQKVIRVVGPDTDLTVGVAGRKFVNCKGDRNMPDGEVFTSPVENATEGRVRFSFPAVYGGREVDDVRLVFRAGKVVEATAAKNEAFLHQMLDTDAGSRRLGELAVGVNYGIDRFTKSILFDEKIGGTVHMAVGLAFPAAGGRNQSAIHWDMICDLRRGGRVLVDGRVIQEQGRFRKGLL